MNKIYWIPLLLLTVLLSGCKKNLGFPTASGGAYEVLVVMDDKQWEAPCGRALFDVLDTDVPGLPQSERSFRISQTDPQHFSQAMTIFRNIIKVNIDPKQFSTTRMRFTRDKFAKQQIFLNINSPSEEDFKEFCQKNSAQIVEFLTKTEMNRLIAELRTQYSQLVQDKTKEMFDCKFNAPKELKSYKKGENFLWFSNNAASGLSNICIYSYPYEGPETFTKEYVLGKRDSVMKVNLPGEKPNMYMKTDTLLTQVKAINVHDSYAMEARGLWYMENDFMGGPFVSHSRVDTINNRVIVVEGFVYAPEKLKRGLMRRMEGALYTLMLPQEVKMTEISTDVEEQPKTPSDKINTK